MENKENEDVVATSTTTTVETKENVQLSVRSPLFIIFAEYLGYESPLIEWAESWCNGKVIDKYQKSVIELDALDVYEKMRLEYSDEELRNWYGEFYDVVLSDYELNLIRLELAEQDDKTLPF